MSDDSTGMYGIRFQMDSDGPELQVRVVAERRNQTVTLVLPDGGRLTVDVVTARAMCMLLHQAVYASLEPTGPLLRLERRTADGWVSGGTDR